MGGWLCAEGCEWVDGCAPKVASGWTGGERRRLDFGSQFAGGRKRPAAEVEPHRRRPRREGYGGCCKFVSLLSCCPSICFLLLKPS